MQQDRKNRILFDRLSATALIVFLAPILCARALQAKLRTGRVFDRQSQADGRHALLRFAGIPRGRDLARILNVAAGTVAWVGPPVLPAHRRRRAGDLPLSSLRPGLISVWKLQQLTGSAYDERPTHSTYPNHTLKESIAILFRYLVARSMSVNPGAPKPEQFTLLGVKISNLSIDDSLARIQHAAQTKTQTQFAFVNPDCLNKASKDTDYTDTLNSLPTVFADGIGIRIACKRLGIGLRDNVNGTDLFPLLCEQAIKNNQSMYFLGGAPGVTDTMVEKLLARFPDLQVAGHQHGFFDTKDTNHVIEDINASGADMLFVAFGAPKQDAWLAKHQAKLQPSVLMGVGGLFDFYSDRISRAPRWLRDVGMEWTWRLLQEPGRMWRRYLVGNPLFLWRVRREAKELRRTAAVNRFGESNLGFRGAKLRYRIRHFLWTFAVHLGTSLKRLMDIVVSALALIALSPLLLVVAILIKLESPGPLVFAQIRVGQYGRFFTMYKFRSMRSDAEDVKQKLMEQNEMEGGVLFKMKDDPRITRTGRFIRKYSIDELPQLWNVLNGSMSLVGPRPPVQSEVDQYSIKDRRRLDVKPGITCIWQVSGRSEIAFAEQVELDVDYIESHGFLTDLKILFKTIPAVLLGKGAY